MDMPFDALISNEMEIENEDLFGTGPFESFTAAESLEVCRLLGLNGADGVDVNTMPESSNSGSRKKITSEEAAAAAATHNRVVSERKRREQLSERFIVLGSLIPGLKKMDKASVMEDTMKHTEELNEQIKSLESELECYLKNESDHSVEQETNSSTTTDAKVVVVVRKEHMELMVRESSNKNIYIRNYYSCVADGKCDISIASKLLSYLQTIQLTVLSTCFMPFEEHDIAIIAKKMKNSNHDISLQELQQKICEIIESGDLV